MANTRSGNTYYVDATGDLLTNKGIRVKAIIITPSGANGGIVLKDQVTLSPKGTWTVPTSSQTTLFDLSESPLVFPNGINVGTVTTATAILVLDEVRS